MDDKLLIAPSLSLINYDEDVKEAHKASMEYFRALRQDRMSEACLFSRVRLVPKGGLELDISPLVAKQYQMLVEIQSNKKPFEVYVGDYELFTSTLKVINTILEKFDWIMKGISKTGLPWIKKHMDVKTKEFSANEPGYAFHVDDTNRIFIHPLPIKSEVGILSILGHYFDKVNKLTSPETEQLLCYYKYKYGKTSAAKYIKILYDKYN